jgi:hypothetical protein
MAVMAGYGQVTAGYWPAVTIGAVLALIAAVDLVVATTAKVTRARQRRSNMATTDTQRPVVREPSQESHDPLADCRELTAEAVVVRELIVDGLMPPHTLHE